MNLYLEVFMVLVFAKSVHLYCDLYHGDICKSYSTGYVWYNENDDLVNEKITSGLWKEMISSLTEPCRSNAEKLLCAYAFPKCFNKDREHYAALPLCYEDCMAVKMQFCYLDWIVIEEQKRRGVFLESRGHFRFPECESLPRFSDKGSHMMCHNLGITDMDSSLITTNCVNGNGRYYQGTMNVTETGLSCQSWESQHPHQHTRPPLVFSEIQNATNYCRNAGGEEDKPWCYTKDPNVRWQHCNIPVCANSSDGFDEIEESNTMLEIIFRSTFILLLSVGGLGCILGLVCMAVLCQCLKKNLRLKDNVSNRTNDNNRNIDMDNPSNDKVEQKTGTSLF